MANPYPKPRKPGSPTPWRKSFIPSQVRRVNKQARIAARSIARMRES